MSIRTSVPSDGAWHQIGTGPATVQVISDSASLMVEAAASAPTGADGLVMGPANQVQHFSLAQAIWAQVLVQGGAAILVAVQQEAT